MTGPVRPIELVLSSAPPPFAGRWFKPPAGSGIRVNRLCENVLDGKQRSAHCQKLLPSREAATTSDAHRQAGAHRRSGRSRRGSDLLPVRQDLSPARQGRGKGSGEEPSSHRARVRDCARGAPCRIPSSLATNLRYPVTHHKTVSFLHHPLGRHFGESDLARGARLRDGCRENSPRPRIRDPVR